MGCGLVVNVTGVNALSLSLGGPIGHGFIRWIFHTFRRPFLQIFFDLHPTLALTSLASDLTLQFLEINN